MTTAVYALCALTSAACAVLLLRAWAQGRQRLVLWTALCFVGLAVNNLLLLVDLRVLTDVDLSTARDLSGLVAVSVLLLGLVWESR